MEADAGARSDSRVARLMMSAGMSKLACRQPTRMATSASDMMRYAVSHLALRKKSSQGHKQRGALCIGATYIEAQHRGRTPICQRVVSTTTARTALARSASLCSVCSALDVGGVSRHACMACLVSGNLHGFADNIDGHVASGEQP